jgi:Tfp pilus assembly protein PilO
MALRIGELPFFAQLLICLLFFAGVVVAGEFYGPFVADKKVTEGNLETEVSKLRGVVNQLQDAKKRHADLQTGLKSLEEQLERTKEVVPAEKQTDQFILMVQSSARSGGITLRRLTARGVVYKDFYAEMPFEIEYDGAYYNLVNFFRQLGQSNRIINASALKLDGVEARRGRFEYAPGTTVAGTCTVTTFFTPSREELAAAAPPPRPGARGAPAQPRR